MEECTIITNHEGFLVNSCTGEVVDFENYSSTDYSSLQYYERVSSSARKREENEIRDMKKIVLNYLLSIMTGKEKDEFYRILNQTEKHGKAEAALYLAIYEHILAKENKQVRREYLKFLKSRGIGRYAIRQRKKLLRQMLKEDPVVIYMYYEYQGNKEEALRVYELLKKHNLAYGNAKKRKQILLKYLNDKKLLNEVLEKEKIEELRNTVLLLNIRDFESVSFI
ncbi:hypothetical protein HA72_2192 [Metallosphaera sedula]|uniref:Uncharacterized protein n=2 Tax=Metallosphaera sedula TaxID=43687 RepID=A4YIS9_METS5|nr:hypothetical protein [Metallosphaera sedula]ABP96331.1 hypothetical protein Msed_2192 [Metallosphaera sedula DSM 5348]AIM28314.1 hypothetical protein HA72_2192 [Metallosphaera sedula]AKV75115.1 hypothetical protein MsedA_2245 [Metallosphaera sedula]AKV77353.1 hypothetical protein MsedB_2247 [Metallosphaera sedula]AKV79604.1 hypothetical protein MsedC_2245 [Metallosphaera sedula]